MSRMSRADARRSERMELISTRVYGVAFLAILALLVGLSIGSYAKVFTSVVNVSLETNRIGNQLQELSDVKIRGLVVGEVRSVESDGEKATVHLALNPDHVELIPANTQARLLPKTLFGEKYVSLVEPKEPADRHIRAGDVIKQDRSETAIELEQVFEGLLPLLQAVQPQDLAVTLNAMATALEGRGDRLGQNLTLVNEYFREINPHMPTIQADISGLADLASLYADASPDLLRMLRNFTTTGTTIVEKEDTYVAFLSGTAGFANTTREVLSENEDRIVRLGRVSRPTMDLLAEYSPMYPCLASGLANWVPRIEQAYASGSLHLTLEVVPQREQYHPGEEPRFADKRGPSCYDLPSPAGSQANPWAGVRFADGTDGRGGPAASRIPSILVDPASGTAGTAAEQKVMAALLAPQLGMDSSQVPPIGTLLVGPMARGTVVGQR